MPLWCNKHLPGQSASIIIAYEFFGMFVSTRTPSIFLGGRKSCTCFRNNVPFLRPSRYFLWSNDFDNQQHLVLKIVVIDCLPLMGRYFVSKFRHWHRQSWCALCRSVTRLDGTRGKKQLAAPCPTQTLEVQSDHFFITLLTREFLLIWYNFLRNFCWNSSCCVP